jgi:hypothetical protein
MLTSLFITQSRIQNCERKRGMSAETHTTEDIRKDVEDLIKVAAEVGDPLLPIATLYHAVQREDDYLSFLRNSYDRKTVALDIHGESLISRRFVDTVFSLLSRYEKKQLVILLDSAIEVLGHLRLAELRRSMKKEN